MQSETKQCQNCKQNFVIEPDDFTFYEKIKVPAPTFCPECRFQRRALWRNERKLFRGKSALSGKDIFTLFPPESGLVLYTEQEWRSDVWNPEDYGREYDFSKSFFEQFNDLQKTVPQPPGSVLRMVNSDYCQNASDLKNCFLLFNSNQTEDCVYGNGIDRCRFCFDNSHLQKCERCYGSFWLTKCYETHFSSRCEECNNIWFSKDCRGCSFCIGCVNLRMKKYCIFNVQYTKEEYEKKLQEMNLASWAGLTDVADKSRLFWLNFPNKYIQGTKNINVSGEYVTHSKNVKECYLAREGENLKYCQYIQVPPVKDSYDCTVSGSGAELMYENSVCGWGGSNIKFSWECWVNARDMEYCVFCTSSSNLFGCVSMLNKQYCILNKQYSKEEFFSLREKIIAHMRQMPYIDTQGRVYTYGEFFPPEMSPLAYTQTIAPEHFPLTKEQAVKQGFRWKDVSPAEYKTTMDARNIPDNIRDVTEKILQEIIKCEICGRAYRIINLELQFLRKVGIPCPRTCIDCRHDTRISQRNKALFYHRVCACIGMKSENGVYQNTTEHFHSNEPCPNEFETSYSPDRPEIVYCEQCYQQEVV